MTNQRLVFLLAAAVMIGGCDSGKQPEPQRPPAMAPAAPVQPAGELLQLPKKTGSVRLAAIGDAGRGEQWQYEVSAQMQAYRKLFPFDFVLMLGDNVYDSGTPEDYRLKFELPYKPLLDDKVTFHAAIGNH